MNEKPDAPSKLQRPRLHLLVGALTLLAGIYLLIQFLEWSDDNTIEAKYDRIQPGMNIHEVESLFGRPQQSLRNLDGSGGELIWTLEDNRCFFVQYMADETVTRKGWYNSSGNGKKSSLTDIIKSFLRKLGL